MSGLKPSRRWLAGLLSALSSAGLCFCGYWLLGIVWVRACLFALLFVLLGLGLFSVLEEAFMLSDLDIGKNLKEEDDGC